jgi:hypothetical protein
MQLPRNKQPAPSNSQHNSRNSQHNSVEASTQQPIQLLLSNLLWGTNEIAGPLLRLDLIGQWTNLETFGARLRFARSRLGSGQSSLRLRATHSQAACPKVLVKWTTVRISMHWTARQNDMALTGTLPTSIGILGIMENLQNYLLGGEIPESISNRNHKMGLT